MTAQLSLLEPVPTKAETLTRKARWLHALRAQALLHYRGQAITTDELWLLMAHAPDLRIPDGLSPNVLGGFFADWDRAQKTGEYRRSGREGAHRNLLTVWVIR